MYKLSKSKTALAFSLLAFSSVTITSCFKEKDVAQIQQQTGVLQMSPSAGPKNTIITISGVNFSDKASIQVKVNGVNAPIVASTNNNIQVQVPQGAGTGKVQVTFGGTTYEAGTFTYQNTYSVASYAGGAAGVVNGPIASAKFEDVESLAIDASDNLYVGNYYGTLLRKINTTTGTVSTLATTTGGSEFLSTDAAGNIYYVDEDNNQIVKVTPGGATSVLATPSYGIQAIKVGASGNIYVAGRSDIAKFSSTGTQLWRLKSHSTGTNVGDTSQAKFALYGGMDVDPTETKIYVINNTLTAASNYASQIQVLDLSAKTMTAVAGSATVGGFSNGAAADARFSLAYGVTLDKSGGLYVADNLNGAIRYIKGGVVSTVVGGNGADFVAGIGTAAKLMAPQSVVLDSKGNMYIADFGTGTQNQIFKVVID